MAASSTFTANDASGYELQMGRWSRMLAGPFIDFVGVQDNQRILDVGCGTGSLDFALAEKCRIKQLCGIDFSPAYVEYAARKNQDPTLAFQVGDACALPFPDHSFDRVLSLLVLHFVTCNDQAVAEMRRVTRPGGVAAAAVWDARGGWVANRIFFDTAAVLDPKANERRKKNYTRPLTRPGELAKAWEAAGFQDITETTLAMRMEFQSFEDYWSPVRGNDGPHAEYFSSLSKPDQKQLQEAVRQAYLDGEPDGPRSYVATSWAVKGVAPGNENK